MRPLLCLFILLQACQAKECPAIKLKRYQFLDDSCKVYSRKIENGITSILKDKDGKLVAREAIDCDQAKLDLDGSWYYKSHLANGRFFCHKEKK